MKYDFLRNLSEAQRRAALHKEGAALVLAGPGSGKTTVITNRIANLIIYENIKPERILTVTFSRAAAYEMEQRSVNLMRNFGDYGERERAAFCTLHSFCNTILKNFYCARNIPYKILADGIQKQAMLKEIILNINGSFQTDISEDVIEEISGYISRRKSAEMSCDEEKLLNLRSEIQVRNFDKIFEEYERIKRQKGLADFDDMLILAYEKLCDNCGFAERISSRYDFVQVDEGQDLSLMQIEILKKIALHGNIFMVADDDQGIYSFRGADTEGLIKFEKSFDNCKRYRLDENFRSVSNIVDASASLIKNNQNRYSKNLHAISDLKGKIKLYRAADMFTEARFIVELAARNAKRKKSTGILYRNNVSALLPIAVLEEMSGFTYTVSGGATNPRDSIVVKEFMKLSEIPCDNDEFYGRCFLLCRKQGGGEHEAEFAVEFLKAVCRMNANIEAAKQAILNYGKNNRECENTYIHFSTVHSAKGLEYDEVIIIDTAENEFPPSGSYFGHLLEEERRLFYVAMTRAKQALYVLYSRKIAKRKCMQSIFYGELKNAIKTARAQKKNRA